MKIAIVDDLSSVWVQYLALPCFGVLFKLIVDAEIGMILFLYLFIIDYLLVVRAAAFYICQCRLVSTQCIEAGVDLDFPVVFRALAPLDAIIQAAGRCNRNGDSPTGRVIVFVPEEEKLYPSSAYENAANCVRILASRHPIDCNDLSHIQEYYQLLYSQSEGDKQALRQAVEDA